ncbi:MAG TPA: S4 domain-containing protein [Steroidobacteraceae bacterium]|jgi:23S rRNA pseudouridine2605 synthase|nr:S4 domain-containing protein [Steroidobacteraceae bacterium]
MHRQRGEPERLQKVLARAGLASRREAEDWIRAGRLTVNGQAASLGVRVSPDDEVRLDGRVIHQRAPQSGGRAYLYHRSPGESLDAAPAETPDAVPLLARLPKRAGRRFVVVSPMPRIDGGLEIVCGDGELTVRLQRSVRGLSSELSVRVRGELTEQQIEGVLGGVLDSGERLTVHGCEAAGGEGANRWYAIAARGASGKDVRQLFERQGAIVSRVLRTRLGTLALERSLGRGHYRELTREEIEGLLSEAAGSQAEEPQGAADVHRPPTRPKSRQTQAPTRPKSQTQAPGRRRSRGPPRPPVRRGGARH